MNSMLSLSTPQRRPGREPVSVLLFPYMHFVRKSCFWFVSFPHYFFCQCQSLGPSQWGPGALSGYSRAWRSPEGDWGFSRVRSSLHRDASRDWNHFAHAVQLSAPLVGARTWELPWDGGTTLHWRHVRTAESAAGQHHENCSQQLGYWWSLLDEKVGWWARFSFPVCAYSSRLHLLGFPYEMTGYFCS